MLKAFSMSVFNMIFEKKKKKPCQIIYSTVEWTLQVLCKACLHSCISGNSKISILVVLWHIRGLVTVKGFNIQKCEWQNLHFAFGRSMTLAYVPKKRIRHFLSYIRNKVHNVDNHLKQREEVMLAENEPPGRDD